MTHLDLVHVTDGMIEFDGAPFLHIRLLPSSAIHPGLRSIWRWSEYIPRYLRLRCRRRSCLALRATPLLLMRGTVILEGYILVRCWIVHAGAVGHWGAELRLGALNTVLNRLLPAPRSLAQVWRVLPRGWLRAVWL